MKLSRKIGPESLLHVLFLQVSILLCFLLYPGLILIDYGHFQYPFMPWHIYLLLSRFVTSYEMEVFRIEFTDYRAINWVV